MRVEFISTRLMEKLYCEYLLLMKTCPKSELLKYFVLDESGIKSSSDGQIVDEFITKFSKNLLTPEEVRENDVGMSYAEYSFKFCSRLFRNYISSIEKEIKSAESMN